MLFLILELSHWSVIYLTTCNFTEVKRHVAIYKSNPNNLIRLSIQNKKYVFSMHCGEKIKRKSFLQQMEDMWVNSWSWLCKVFSDFLNTVYSLCQKWPGRYLWSIIYCTSCSLLMLKSDIWNLFNHLIIQKYFFTRTTLQCSNTWQCRTLKINIFTKNFLLAGGIDFRTLIEPFSLLKTAPKWEIEQPGRMSINLITRWLKQTF